MNEQAMKFRLGVFVIGSAVILAVLIILFGEFPAILSRQIAYTVTFPEAPGLEEGTPVRKSGVRIGEVTTVGLDPDTGKVTAEIMIDARYQLRMGDQAALGRHLVLGNTTINFLPVPGSDRRPAEAGYMYTGEGVTDIRQALGRATDLVPIVQETLHEIRNAAKGINESMPTMRRTVDEVQVAARNFGRAAERVDVFLQTNQNNLSDTIQNINNVSERLASVLNEENANNVSTTLKNFRTASEQLNTTLKNADTLVTDARGTLKSATQRIDRVGANLEELTKDGRAVAKRLDQSLTGADEIIANLQKATRPLAERSESIVKNLDEGAARFNQITGDVNQFTRSLGEGNGALRRLLNDPALYNRLNDAAAGLLKLVTRVGPIIDDIEVFADKIARHPELLGVRGAVSPSSGLKDSSGLVVPSHHHK